MTGRGGSGALRRRWSELRRGGSDAGSVLVLVLVIAVVLIAVTTVALTNASASSGETGGYAGVTTARLDAESGIQATVLQMKNATSLLELPVCAPQTVPLAYGSYTVSVAYVGASGAALSCPLSGSLPATLTALIDATGTDGSSSVALQGTVTITSTPVPLPAFDYVLYSAGELTLNSLTPVNSGSANALAQVYADSLNCEQDNVLSANVEVGSGGTANVSDECNILGTLYVDNSPVTMSNWGLLDGLELFGGSFEMSGGTVAGPVSVSGGNVSFLNGTGLADDPAQPWFEPPQPPSVTGDVVTSGSVSPSSGAPVTGTICSGSPSCIPSSVRMPSVPSFPEVTDPGTSSWPSGTNDVEVPSPSGSSPTYPTCSSFFSSPWSGQSPFMALVNGSTSSVTVVDAPTCDVSLQGGSPSWGGGCPANDTFTLQSDVVLLVKSFSDSGCIAFDSGGDGSSDSGGHNLAVVVPSPGTGSIVLDPSTSFGSSLRVLLYTPGSVTYECATSMTGQVVAGASIDTYYNGWNSGCPLTYSNQAASIVPTAVQPLLGSVTFTGETLLKD